MSARALAVSAVASVLLVGGAAWLFELTLGRAALLAPVIVGCAGAVAGLAVIWTRAAVESLRRSRRPRLVVGVSVAGLALVATLTWLGVALPRN